MFQVSSELYDEIAIRLREAFGGGGFYSGSVECAVGEVNFMQQVFLSKDLN